MFRNYLRTALRNLRKNKLYAAINISGLTIGLTACLLISLYIRHELSYDDFHVNAARIVRATMEYSSAGTTNLIATTGTKPGPQFKRSFPAIADYTRCFIGHNVVKAGDKLFDEPRILYADPSFFSIFSFRLLQGNAATALDAPDKIVISRSMALKYFGTENAVNKVLTSGKRDLRVSAVCEDAPQNSQLKFDFATQFMNLGKNVREETWWNANWITYFLLQDEKNLAQLQQQVNAYMNSAAVKADAGLQNNSYLTYHLEPLRRVHLYSSLVGFEPNGSIRNVYLFLVVALLILVIACANYTNLATAQTAGRSGEIGMRKVLGASKQQVFRQFIAESAFITSLSAVLAILLGIVLLPYFNNLSGKQFEPASLLQPAMLFALAILTFLVSVFAGLYPAVLLSGTGIIGVLKKGFSFGSGNNLLRKSLIVLQFGISVFLIIYTVILLQQMHYVQTRNLGYDKDHLLVLPVGGNMLQDLTRIKQAFARVSGVESITAAYETPEYVESGDGITATDENGKHEVSLNAMPVDLDFTRTMKMKLVAGRDFQKSDLSLMDTTNHSANYRLSYIINETLARKIGWTTGQAIGKIIEKGVAGPVVGVVKDFNFSSLHDPIGPLLIFLGPDFSRELIVRMNGADLRGTMSRLEGLWKQYVPDRPFNYHFLDDAYNKLYVAEQRSSSLFGIAAAIAIVLACMGLFGLAAFTTVSRTKEIGIRRVLGANIASITLLIGKNFLQLVGIAILLAVPLAWWAAIQWLRDFAFRVPVNVYVFVVTALVTVAIALCTVGYHSIRAGLANPVRSLRTE
jgi:putative ABC transport system permease protein